MVGHLVRTAKRLLGNFFRKIGLRSGVLFLSILGLFPDGRIAGQEANAFPPIFSDSFEYEQRQWPTPNREIACQVRNFSPFLGFEFRFLTGYMAKVPLREIYGPANRFLLRVAVTPIWPETAEGVYFSRIFATEEISGGQRGAMQFNGSSATGEGVYDVAWHLQDEFGRFCITRWQIHAKLSKKDRTVDLTLSPGEIAPSLVYLFRKESMVPPDPIGKMLRIKFLVSMDVRGGRRVTLPLWRYAPVISILRVMTRHPELAEFSLLAFSLDDQQVLFEQDYSDVIDFEGLGKTLEQLTPGTVAVKELGRRKEQDFFSLLLERELKGDEDCDALIFVGWDLGIGKKVRNAVLEKLELNKIPLFFFNPAAPRGWKGLLGNTVKALGGTQYKIRRPRDLTNAMRHMLIAVSEK